MSDELYCEKREPHATTCECDHCIIDRRYELGHRLQLRGVEMGIENNRLLAAILDELRGLRSRIV